jgi:small subunit ribosomal protein S13
MGENRPGEKRLLLHSESTNNLQQQHSHTHSHTLAMYLLGVNLPDHKRVSVALKSFYGVGEATAVAITHRLLIHPACKLGQLSTPQLSALSMLLNGMVLEADARRKVKSSIAKYIESGTYRGSRHLKGYPANGRRDGGVAVHLPGNTGHGLCAAEAMDDIEGA